MVKSLPILCHLQKANVYELFFKECEIDILLKFPDIQLIVFFIW